MLQATKSGILSYLKLEDEMTKNKFVQSPLDVKQIPECTWIRKRNRNICTDQII